jgi:radical SAM superfamily enzyme YgiQ (UPF0313 family)
MQADRRQKTLVFFPPFTSQLYVFPYLSVPVLAGYLQERGLDADQRDFNLEYLHHAIESGAVSRIAQTRRRACLEAMSSDPGQTAVVASELTRLFEAQFVAERWPQIRFDLAQVRRLGDVLAQADPRLGLIPAHDEFDRIASFVSDDNPFEAFFQEVVDPCLLEKRYDVVAVSCAMGPQLLPSLWFAKMAKQRLPNAHVVVGGATINLLDDDSVRPIGELPFIDSVVRYGGPRTLFELITGLERGSDLAEIPNLFDARGGSVVPPRRVELFEVDESHDCSFDSELAPSYPYGFDWLPVQLSLGCYWGRCTFCSYVNLTDRKYEARAAVTFVNQLERLIATHGTRRFRFITEALPPRFCEPFLEEIGRRNLDIEFASFVKVDRDLTPELIQRLADAGMIEVEIGVESLNQRILGKMRKGFSRELVLEQLKSWTAAGVRVELSYIFDFPTTTKEEAIQDANDLYAACNDLIDVTVQPFGLIKGTPVANHPERFGIEIIHDIERSASLGHIQSVLLTMPYLDPTGMSRREKDEVLDIHRAHSATVRERRLRSRFTEFVPRELSIRSRWPVLARFVRRNTTLYELGGTTYFYHFPSKKAHAVDAHERRLLREVAEGDEPSFQGFVERLAGDLDVPPGALASDLERVLHRCVLSFRLPLGFSPAQPTDESSCAEPGASMKDELVADSTTTG